MTPDIGASILSKLKNKAKSTGMSYQQCLQLFLQEEFLRRLSKSRYARNLILKGGLLICALTDFKSRATVDADFLLRRIDSGMEHIDDMIGEILSTPTGNNNVVVLSAMKTSPIALQRKYPGVSTQIIGSIKNVRVPFDVDIGVGDVIVPKALKRKVKTQLDGFDVPEILTYSLESVIAEKFDAILQRFELTGRMKDFFDIHYLAHFFDFDGRNLHQAIEQTLGNRGTSYDHDSFNRVVSLSEDAVMQTKWRYFLRTINEQELPFTDVLQTVNVFIRPVYEAIVSKAEFSMTWDHAESTWR